MNYRLFKRKAQVTVGKLGETGKQIDGVRFSFSIEMTDTKHTNKGSIDIYNLSEETLGYLEQKDASIIIKTAYDDQEFSTLFIGNITEFETDFNGVDIVTKVKCRDGYIPLTERKLSLSFAAGSNTQQIVKNITAQLNLNKGDYSKIPNLSYKQGFSFVGAPGTALDTVLARSGWEWTIVNNTLIVSKENESSNETIMQYISPDTGLVDQPKRFKERARAGKTKVKKNRLLDGWKIKSLIIPSIQPKSLIKVSSKELDGTFLVKAVKFTGDTHSQDWYAEIDAMQK